LEKSDPYKLSLFILVAGLLIFAPLARGAVHLWAGTIVQILTLAALGVMIFTSLKTKTPVFRKTILSTGITGLVALVLVSFICSFHKPFAFEGVFMFLTYGGIYYAVVAVCRSRKLERALVYVIIGTAFFVCLIAILKRVELNPFFWWIYPEMGEYKEGFLTGVYVNQNHLAGFLEMVIPMVMVLFVTRFRSLEQKFIITGILVVLVITQVFTLSYGGWVSCLGALLFLSAVLALGRQFDQKRMVITVGVCAALLGVTVLAATPVVETVSSLTRVYPEESVSARVRTWEGTIHMIRDHLWTGTGPGTFAIAYPGYQVPGLPVLSRKAHNDYLQILSETGIVCLPVILLILFNFFKFGFKTLKIPSRQKQGFTLGGMAGVFAILVHSFYDFNLFVPANAVLFTVIAAIASAREPGN
jgi:O-antigen ligase